MHFCTFPVIASGIFSVEVELCHITLNLKGWPLGAILSAVGSAKGAGPRAQFFHQIVPRGYVF